jgi:NADH dehydrogenase FAD-containing subunit
VVDTVTRIDAAERSVTLATGGTVGYDFLVYAVGSGSADPRVPGAAEFAYPIASLEAAERLRSVVDAAPATAAVTVVGAGETLTSVDDVRIVAAGDSAAPSDLPNRMSCQAAGPLGAQAADTVLSRIAGEQPAPINLGFAGQCISLGRRAGIFQFAYKDDTARGSNSAAALARSSRSSFASTPSSSWRTRQASPVRARGPRMTGASSCCRPSAARRWPPLNGQPHQPFVVGPVDYRRSSEQRIVVNLTCHSRAPGGVPLLLWMHA